VRETHPLIFHQQCGSFERKHIAIIWGRKLRLLRRGTVVRKGERHGTDFCDVTAAEQQQDELTRSECFQNIFSSRASPSPHPALTLAPYPILVLTLTASHDPFAMRFVFAVEVVIVSSKEPSRPGAIARTHTLLTVDRVERCSLRAAAFAFGQKCFVLLEGVE
jgi:hypothetical protein